MADDNKTFSQDEHIAILADRVARETADLTAERDQLKTEKADLESKLDVETSAKAAAEQAKADAERELAEFKAQVDGEREAASRKDERIAKVREAAKHLDEGFFTDEARVARIVAMEETTFEGYVSDLASTAKVTGNTAHTGVPRETAMQGQKAEAGQPVAKAGSNFLMRRYVAPTENKEG